MKHARGTAPRRHSLLPPILLLILAFLLMAAARGIPGFAEYYAVHIYPIWQGSLGRLTGLCPVSVAEIGCLLLPVLLVIDLIANRHRLRNILWHLFVLLSVLAFLYAANCGVNYSRDPFVSQAEAPEISIELLADFCEYTVARLEDSSAEGCSYPSRGTLAETARGAMNALGEEHPSLTGFYPRPKQLTVLSRFFSDMGVSGVYSPFTIEANINGEMPDCIKPFTACHELSHLRGFMNEGEANYIGWLACIGSEDPAFRRSGWIEAWNYAGGTLRRVDPDRFDALREQLPADVRAELDENNRFWREHETKASEIQDQVNDAYLKANGHENGIAGYGQVTTLMLRWYAEQELS